MRFPLILLTNTTIQQCIIIQLFDKYQCGPENLTRHYTYKLMKKLKFSYGAATYKSYNKINLSDNVLIDYQEQYKQLVASGVELKHILNVDATKCYGNILPRRTYKKYKSSCNSGTLNTHKNVNHYFTLLNTITANGDILQPFFVVPQRHAYRFKSKTLYDLVTSIDQPVYQHKRLKYIVTFNKGGSLNSNIMMEYVTRIVASDTPRHLLLDAASINKTQQFKIHCTFKNILLKRIVKTDQS